MKRFKEFLHEMPMLLPDYDKVKAPHEVPFARPGNKISDYNDEYAVHKNVGGRSLTNYSLVHKPTRKTHMEVGGRQYDYDSEPSTFRVQMLGGTESSKVKAHDFYHHLVIKHNLQMGSDTQQSIGGMKVWHRLSQKPDIEMRHHNPGDHTVIQPGTSEDDFKKFYGHRTIFTARKR